MQRSHIQLACACLDRCCQETSRRLARYRERRGEVGRRMGRKRLPMSSITRLWICKHRLTMPFLLPWGRFLNPKCLI